MIIIIKNDNNGNNNDNNDVFYCIIKNVLNDGVSWNYLV